MYIHSGLELRGASAWAHISIDASVMMLPDGQKLLNHLTVGLRSSLTIVWLPVAKPSNRNAKWRHKLIKKLLQLYAKVFKIRFVPTIYNATQLNVSVAASLTLFSLLLSSLLRRELAVWVTEGEGKTKIVSTQISRQLHELPNTKSGMQSAKSAEGSNYV